MRCFIAIDINEKIRDNLVNLQKQFDEKAGFDKGVKWTRPGSIHLTLKFLGDIERKESVSICRAAEKIASDYSKFDFLVEGIGCFGGKRPRVLWAGCGEGSRKLKELQSDLEEELAKSGWAKDKRSFAPHLTLCRIKSGKAGKKLKNIPDEYEGYRLGKMAVNELVVYESELTRKGPVYTVLGSYELQ
jgi:2'-5' RNA ligase